MQSAEAVLGAIRDRGRRGLPLERLYRQLFNPQLFLVAYGRIYSNRGAMTPGVAAETVDGMSLARIDGIIGALRAESYRWSPAKRVYIPKKDGKRRPLGLPSWSDKLVAEVVRLLLEAYYDVQFSDHSHGFRSGRGCHTALREVATVWTGTHWFIEGDISDCFGSLDHEVMLSTLAEKIHDGRFLRLVGRMLKAGYLEEWRFHATLSGVPQGGVVSPLLSNIYLDRFDRFVEERLLPRHNRGEHRRGNPEYARVAGAIHRAKRKGDRDSVRRLRLLARTLPSRDMSDPAYRRLRYVRYADDFLLGFAGPKAEAEEIKAEIARFLREELRLELSRTKTLITHAVSQAARFLGYEIKTQFSDTKITGRQRSVNGVVGLYVPGDVVRQHCAAHMRGGKPVERGVLIHDSDYTIVMKYQAEYRGLVQYYLLAQNVRRLGKVRWVLESSMLRTLAAKHKSTVSRMAARYKAVIETPYGPRSCFEVVVMRDKGRKPLTARFGGIPLRRERTAEIADVASFRAKAGGNELIRRLLAGACENCGARTGLEVHHVRALADLNRPGRTEPHPWSRLMAQKRRKTLVVCDACHHQIHNGNAPFSTRKRPLESDVR